MPWRHPANLVKPGVEASVSTMWAPRDILGKTDFPSSVPQHSGELTPRLKVLGAYKLRETSKVGVGWFGSKLMDNQRAWRNQPKGHEGNIRRRSQWTAVPGGSERKGWKQAPG